MDKIARDVHSPVLVVDFNAAAANHLAEQLRHGGLQVDVTTSGAAARAAAYVRHYAAVVVVADLSHPTSLDCLASVRAAAPDAWMIVVSLRDHPKANQVIRECGADSLLAAPFSLDDLIARLSALSRRSRLRL